MLEGCARHERRDGKQVRPRFAKPESALGPRAHGGNEARIGGFHQGQQGQLLQKQAEYKAAICLPHHTNIGPCHPGGVHTNADEQQTTSIFGRAEGEGGAGGRRFAVDRTLQEIASQHQVHPNQVGAWKRQAMEGLVEVFSKGAERRVRDHESEVRDLHAKIGELIVERDFLSRGSGR